MLSAQLSFLNMVRPLKLGDLAFPLLARRAVGADLLDAAGAILCCRVSDLCVVVALLALCGACLITPAEHPWLGLAVAGFGLISLLLSLALAPLMRLFRARPPLSRVPGPVPDRASAQHGPRTFHLALTSRSGRPAA
jgi:hypothetical protein